MDISKFIYSTSEFELLNEKKWIHSVISNSENDIKNDYKNINSVISNSEFGLLNHNDVKDDYKNIDSITGCLDYTPLYPDTRLKFLILSQNIIPGYHIEDK